ncbi:ribosome biogenesis protein nsa-2 [Apiospora arundinis]
MRCEPLTSPPFLYHDPKLAALLAVIGFVILQQGRLGLAFFAYQAEACYWIGYWLEWWTGVIGFLFSLLGCATDDETRYVPGSLFSFGPQANGPGGVGVELGVLPPPYSDEAIGRRLGCIGRFRSYIAHQCRKLEQYLRGMGIRTEQSHLRKQSDKQK